MAVNNPVDTSFYPKPMNPLEMMQSGAGIMNALTQNRLMQAELPGIAASSKQKEFENRMTQAGFEVNKLLADSTDPTTGKPNLRQFIVGARNLGDPIAMQAAYKLASDIGGGVDLTTQGGFTKTVPAYEEPYLLGEQAAQAPQAVLQDVAHDKFATAKKTLSALHGQLNPEASLEENMGKVNDVLRMQQDLHNENPEAGLPPEAAQKFSEDLAGVKDNNELLGKIKGYKDNVDVSHANFIKENGVPSNTHPLLKKLLSVNGPVIHPNEFGSAPADIVAFRNGTGKLAEERRGNLDSAEAANNIINNAMNLKKLNLSAGPTQEWKQGVIGALSDAFGVPMPKSTTDYAEMKKFAGSAALSQFADSPTGRSLVKELDTIISANPNKEMPPDAFKEMANRLEAMGYEAKARARAQEASLGVNETPKQYTAFKEEWPKINDPELFQFMAADDKQQFVKEHKLTKARIKQLQEKESAMDQLGAFNDLIQH